MSSGSDEYKNWTCCWRDCTNNAVNPSKVPKARIPFKKVRDHNDKKACLKLLEVKPTAWCQRAEGKYYVACSNKNHHAAAFFKAVAEYRRTTEDKNTPKPKVRYLNSIISDSRLRCLHVAKARVRGSWATKAAVFRLSDDPSAGANCCCCAGCRCFAWYPFSGAYLG